MSSSVPKIYSNAGCLRLLSDEKGWALQRQGWLNRAIAQQLGLARMTQATGVEVDRAGETFVVEAEDIILSTGIIQSPLVVVSCIPVYSGEP
jgi:hypothetical protein